MEESDRKQILLIGAENLSNQMLIYSIERQLGIQCSIFPQSGELFSGQNRNDLTLSISSGYSMLFLFDCHGKSIEEVLNEISANPFISTQLIALYNLETYSEAEAKSLTKQVRGFFYVDDTMEIFLKGIKALFQGEVWISRQILLSYVMKTVTDGPRHHRPQIELTEREQQILSLVSIGTNNEEISDKLCISINTVKTHMYNIFKKIQVTNRLQAALWAAKNL